MHTHSATRSPAIAVFDTRSRRAVPADVSAGEEVQSAGESRAVGDVPGATAAVRLLVPGPRPE